MQQYFQPYRSKHICNPKKNRTANKLYSYPNIMKTKLIISFLSSMLVFLLTCWTSGYSLYVSAMVGACCFFALTYYVVEKYAAPNTFGAAYVTAISLGRVILEIPLRISNFPETLFSMFTTFVAIVSILLASLYFKEKRYSVLFLSIVILVLLSTVAQAEWLHAFRHDR